MSILKLFPFHTQAIRVTGALILGFGITACGGGGGAEQGFGSTAMDSASTANTNIASTSLVPSTPLANSPYPAVSGNDLMIAEVVSNFYSNDVAWFEVYNPTAQPINLSAYALRSGYIDNSSSASSLTPMAFDLPAVDVPAKGYLVIASRVFDKLQNSNQIVYVNKGSAVPYWNSSGSLELVSGGKTIDFVRFGASTAAPLTNAEWSGANVAALPSGANEHGRSIVRLASGAMADTNSARDWSLVNFATPSGINDIAPGVTDSDRDGVPDSAKISGGTYAGIDLYAMGARRGQRDLFIEIDYMKSSDPGITPRQEAMQKIVDAFAEKNIALHIDTGNLYSAALNPAQFNLGGGNTVDYAACIELRAASEGATQGCTSFYDYKSRHFDTRRKLLFHYAVFANSLSADGRAGSSGIAEVHGNDLIVSLGGYGFSTTPGKDLNMLVNLQASTLMHELGHNLGLLHGGNEDLNYKPNHYSVMNYMYQFAGLSTTPDSMNAAERYFLANGLKGKTYCNLVENSPCSSTFKLGYSNGSSLDLDENNLLESANLGRGSVAGAYADWNNDSVHTVFSQSRNLNPQSGVAKTVLRDYDEWNNLSFSFARGFSGSNTGSSVASKMTIPRGNPMNQHPQHRVQEESLPMQLHDELRKVGKRAH